MTETSFFHNSTALGDADQAPYDQETYARLTEAFHSTEGAWVLPDQLNNLEVSTAFGMLVSVATGRALIYGYWFENDALTTVVINSNTSVHGRWDLVVAQINTETGTASFASIPGAPGSIMSIPSCNTCETIKQLPLALVYVEPSAAAIHAADIYDQRLFLNNIDHINKYSTTNDFPNGLFLGWADSENTGTARRPMPGWSLTGATAPSIKDAERFDWMPYGRCLQFYDSPSDDGMQITVQTYDNSTDMITFSMWMKVSAGTMAVSFAGTSKTFYPCKDTYHVIFHASTTGNAVLSLTADGTDIDIICGDFRLAQGFCEAEMLPNYYQQVVMFDAYVMPRRDPSAAYPLPALTSLSTSDVVVYNVHYGNTEDVYSLEDSLWFSPHVMGYIFQLKANDSGSGGSSTPKVDAMTMNTTGEAELSVHAGRAGNDIPRYSTGVIHSGRGTSGWWLILKVTASGAGALDVEPRMIGVIL